MFHWPMFFDLVFGCPLVLIPGLSLLSTFFSMCSLSLLITSSFISVIFLEVYTSRCPSDVFVPDLVVTCYFTYPPYHPHLVHDNLIEMTEFYQ